ncbi:hypothetical protein PAMP_011355 [Pampus punctatissimus]
MSTNMLTDILLSVFFVTGALAACRSDLFITTPRKMEALSGSCLQIPCNFSARKEEEFNSSRTTIGLWIKNDSRFKKFPNNVIFKSSQTRNTYPMKMIGNLNQKNCTTLFSSLNTTYTDTYFFRIENLPFKATAICDPPQIQVIDSPRSPRIEISGELKEKESVTITCSAFTPCPHFPPELTWNLQQNAHNKIEENKNRTLTTIIQITITLSDKHDGENITCSARYPVNKGKGNKTAEGKVTLSVLFTYLAFVSMSRTRNTSWIFSAGGAYRRNHRERHTHQPACLCVSQTGEDPASKTEEAKGQKEGEDLHYGEIDFSKLGLEPSSDSVQVSRQQQDTVYAQVNVSKPTNSLTQTTDGPEDLLGQKGTTEINVSLLEASSEGGARGVVVSRSDRQPALCLQ